MNNFAVKLGELSMNKNTGNYLNDAQFEVEIYPHVYWVSMNSLGKTQYTNEDMEQIVKLPMQERKKKIHNLYEAIQLFHVSNFKGTFDNVDFWIDNIHWQTHKTKEEAVLSNEGCCATDTNWLSYFITERYDRVGSFCYANRDGNGHITTYIKQNKYYYFIDMMMCRKDSQEYFGKENGNRDEFLKSEWAGFLFRCENPISFCHFNIEKRKAKQRDIPFCFYMRDTDQVTATGLYKDDNEVVFYIPSCDNPYLVYQEDDKSHKLSFVGLPLQLQSNRNIS